MCEKDRRQLALVRGTGGVLVEYCEHCNDISVPVKAGFLLPEMRLSDFLLRGARKIKILSKLVKTEARDVCSRKVYFYIMSEIFKMYIVTGKGRQSEIGRVNNQPRKKISRVGYI